MPLKCAGSAYTDDVAHTRIIFATALLIPRSEKDPVALTQPANQPPSGQLCHLVCHTAACRPMTGTPFLYGVRVHVSLLVGHVLVPLPANPIHLSC